jgi:hypothetical protein
VKQIAAAQREHARAAGQLRGARHTADQAQASLDESVAAVTVTERALRRAAAEHSLLRRTRTRSRRQRGVSSLPPETLPPGTGNRPGSRTWRPKPPAGWSSRQKKRPRPPKPNAQCPPGLAWPAAEAEWEGGETPRSVLDIYEAVLTVTRGLTATETSLKMSTTRLTRALEDLQAQLAAAGQDYHPEWDGADGVIVVRIADEQGPLPAGAFATRIAAARRDQQLLLSQSEQRILEDALLTRLAQQIHERTVDARDLIRPATTCGRPRARSAPPPTTIWRIRLSSTRSARCCWSGTAGS